MAEKKTVVTIDPSMQYSRQLHYAEMHSGWHVFRAVYWSIYILFVGLILYTGNMNTEHFFGIAVMLLALFYIVYGFSTSLHLKLMKRYA